MKTVLVGVFLEVLSLQSVHWDFIAEVSVIREVKVGGGPMQGGFSTSFKAADAFIKTSHLMAALEDKFRILTSSTHKEATIGAGKNHEKTLEAMVYQMANYMDQFTRAWQDILRLVKSLMKKL